MSSKEVGAEGVSGLFVAMYNRRVPTMSSGMASKLVTPSIFETSASGASLLTHMYILCANLKFDDKKGEREREKEREEMESEEGEKEREREERDKEDGNRQRKK